MPKQIPDNHWLRKKPIAHRGLHNLSGSRPENSLASFEEACKKGFPIELDVRISKEGEPIVFHDSNTKRISSRSHKVRSSSINVLKTLKILNTQEHIPTLAESLTAINGRVPVLIEIKNFSRPGMPEDAVIKVLRSYKGEVALQCFSPSSLRYLRKNYSEYLSGLIIGRVERLFIQGTFINMLINSYASPQFINYHLSGNVFMSFVNFYKKQNIPILAWTIRSISDEKKARRFADNIVFENYIPKQ